MEPSTEPWRVPDNWNPYQGTEEPTYVFLQNPDEKPEYMTNFVDRYWAKWEQNIAPVVTEEAEDERALMKRRHTLKMHDDDPDEMEEEHKQSPGVFSTAQAVSDTNEMFAHLDVNVPATQQQPPQQQQQPTEPSFYEQFLKGKATEPEDLRPQVQE